MIICSRIWNVMKKDNHEGLINEGYENKISLIAAMQRYTHNSTITKECRYRSHAL